MPPAALARRIEIAKPPYWALVERYVQVSSGGSEILTSATNADLARLADDAKVAAATRSNFLGPVAEFWRARRAVTPALSISKPPIIAAAADGPTSITVGCVASWGLDASADNFPASLAPEAIAELRNHTKALIAASPCDLTLDVTDSGELHTSWSGADGLVTGFSETLAKASALAGRLESLDRRTQIEQALDDALGGEMTRAVSEEDAFELLKRIWEVKDPSAEPPANLPALVQNARGGKIKWPGKRVSQLLPTILAEYFVGPDYSYAICWSTRTDNGSVVEGPTVLRLSESGALTAADQTAIGTALLDPVLQSVEQAANFKSPINDFGDQLGVVIAPDERMSLLSIPTLKFGARTTRLGPVRPETGQRPSNASWQSLEELHGGRLQEFRCAYVLLSTLAALDKWDSVPVEEQRARRWAAQTVDQARAAAR